MFLTGAGSGIGRLLSLKLAKEGAKLALADINRASVEQTVAEASRMGVVAKVRTMELIKQGCFIFTYLHSTRKYLFVKMQAYHLDVTNREQVYRVAEQIHEEFGPVGRSCL